MITSRQNPKVKALARLKTKRGRKEAGAFLVEGAREIARALASERVRPRQWVVAPERIATAEEALLRAHPDLPQLAVAAHVMEKLAYREHPGGLLLVAEARWPPLDALPLPRPPLVVVAVGIEKPGNLGAVFRSADAAGAAVVVADPRVEPFAPQTIRASTGTVFTVPFAVAPGEAVRSWLKAAGLFTVATSPAAETLYWDAKLKGPVAILVGPEETGLDSPWLAAADQTVRVPMKGAADSLNTSVTAALLLYEALRQRRG